MQLGEFAEGGLVSTAQARAVGVGYSAVRRSLRSGELHRLAPGWYAVETPSSAQERHTAVARAWVRRLGGAVLASHHTAVLLHGLPTVAGDLATVHLCRLADRQSRRGPGLSIHPAVLMPTALDRGWGRSSAVALPVAIAVVQTGMVSGPRDSLVAGDAALHRGLTSMRDIQAAAELLRRQPGLAGVRPLLPYLDGRHESPGETLLAYVMRGLGLRFTPQVWVQGVEDWRVDFMLDDSPVIVEFDGAIKYVPGEEGRRALLAEKRREDDLRGMGFEVVRFTWPDLDRPRIVRAKVAAAVRRARR